MTQAAQLVEAYLPLVGAIARTVARRLPSTVDHGDLVSDGAVGLLEAVRRYDPARGVGFGAYAGYRIRGAIYDGLRARDPLSRAARRAARAAGGVAPLQFVDLEQAVTVPDDADGPEALVLEVDLRAQVRRGLLALPPRDREVLMLRFVRGLSVRRTAAQLELSVTRVVEIQRRAQQRLRRLVEGEPSRPWPAPSRRQEVRPRIPKRRPAALEVSSAAAVACAAAR
ncbi:MAG: sigma-70 family RNA polymerase sigma factor [Armatimonadota bacterium]|nr:sigma-70 family RNA polymerase sigma factor [Armatimonadota bacterium]MDR7487140.1 sigma-70 family RNA polymerase sigma factor [Armatimonadota bacterium]MDR7533550.1 sigma-70 family RNA polymerase sigma factor [Armatimonadota bacterium]MDR7536860.1 sigma-70 family RNA polymerase sigma factor [Armatimonadota bacterium]